MKKSTCLSFLALTFCFLQSHAAAGKIPFQSKEPLKFIDVEKDKLSGVGRPSDFIGVLVRQNIPDPIERQVDLYHLKKAKDLQLNPKRCSQIAEEILGPLNSLSLEAGAVSMKKLKSAGKVCSVVLKDKDPQETMPERHLLIGILNLKVYAFVFKHAKSPATSKLESEFQFIDSLR